jgi:hypothetical protein
MSDEYISAADQKAEIHSVAAASPATEQISVVDRLKAIFEQTKRAQYSQADEVCCEPSGPTEGCCLEKNAVDFSKLNESVRADIEILEKETQAAFGDVGAVTAEVRRAQNDVYQGLRNLYIQGGENALAFFVQQFNAHSPDLILSMREEKGLCEELNSSSRKETWDSVYSVVVSNRVTGLPVELNNVAFR